MRNRLFEFWFHSSPRKSDFAFMSADIRDADGIQNYAAIIIRLDNPNLKSIVAEFTETIQMLSFLRPGAPLGGLAIALCFPADIHPVASITRYGEPTRRIAAES
mgnify:CR=1 FL=1